MPLPKVGKLSMETFENGFAKGREAYEALSRSRRETLRISLEEEFGRRPPEMPVVLEIGSGHGHFLTAYAANHPGHWCIGIDLIRDRVRRAGKKRDRGGHQNLRFLQCEAREFLDCLPVGVLFHKTFVLFPDPWPKKRHHKNRLLNATFFDVLAGRCHTGARLYFRTDHFPYYDEVRQATAVDDRWEELPEAELPFEATTVFQQRAESFASLVFERTSKRIH